MTQLTIWNNYYIKFRPSRNTLLLIIHCLIVNLLIIAPAWASPGLHIYSPTDKLTTFEDVVRLYGIGKDLVSLKVNAYPLEFSEDGKFGCGLILHDHKNYVEVRARDSRGRSYLKKFRILKLDTYPDIKDHWAEKKIIYLASLGFIEGYPDGNFYPNAFITRGELASWLTRVKNISLPELSQDPFLDVPKEHWRASAIAAAADKGYMGGITKGYFGIDEALTRAQAAYIAAEAEGLNIVWKPSKSYFHDVPKESSEAPPINAAKKRGLVIGISKKVPLFDPYRNLTRAEAAVLLSRFTSAQKATYDLFDFSQGFDKNVYAKLNVAPKIEEFSLEPSRITVGAESVFKLRVHISSREGFYPISKVKVDLSSVGGGPDVEMFDNATFGDEVAWDGIYSLNLKLTVAESGEKVLKAVAIDTFGWEGKKEASLWVVE